MAEIILIIIKDVSKNFFMLVIYFVLVRLKYYQIVKFLSKKLIDSHANDCGNDCINKHEKKDNYLKRPS